MPIRKKNINFHFLGRFSEREKIGGGKQIENDGFFEVIMLMSFHPASQFSTAQDFTLM